VHLFNQLGQAEIRAFWLLFQLTGGLGRQSFRDYYGIPRKNMVATGGPQSWEGVAGWRDVSNLFHPWWLTLQGSASWFHGDHELIQYRTLPVRILVKLAQEPS
jgi:hypothetical protein